jgi:anti-anti-sigma factor
MTELLHVEQGTEPNVLVLDGELDMSTTDMLDEAVESLRSAGIIDVIVDVAALSFVDSRGLRSLLTASTAGSVILRNPSPAFQRLLTVAGLAEHFPTIG